MIGIPRGREEHWMASEVSVSEIIRAEIPEVADFLSRQVRREEPRTTSRISPADRLRWLLLKNPARKEAIPLGWRIRGIAGGVVGAAICSPFAIGVGDFRTTALMFSKFFVDVPYRGMGLGLLMRFVNLGQYYPLFVTSTNELAGKLFARVGASEITGMDHTMLAVRRLGPVAEEYVQRRYQRPGIARNVASVAWIASLWVAPKLPHKEAGKLVVMNSAQDVNALNLPATIDRLAVVRDQQYLQWRYFTDNDDKQVHGFEMPGQHSRMVVVNLLQSGYRRQIRVLNVLDIWPATTPEMVVPLVASLTRQYRGKFDVIWLRSQPAEVEDVLHKHGLKRHNFPSPLGWYIDQQQQLPTQSWYLMPGESE